MKTQCPHCKAKFKTPEEYTGKKVRCPKCKESFVCAELIEPATPIKQLGNTQEIAEKCENCGRVIGKLEQPCVYKDNVVCQRCNEALRNPLKAFSQEPVRVTPTKSTSGFGVAALVLGIIACLTCWIPFFGFSALPLAFLGVLFGVLGLICSAVTRRSFFGLPLAGSFVSVTAIVVYLSVTGVTTWGIKEVTTNVLDTIDTAIDDTTSSVDTGGTEDLSTVYYSEPIDEAAKEKVRRQTKVGKPFFGIYLGESLEEFGKRFSYSKYSRDSSWSKSDLRDSLIVEYEVQTKVDKTISRTFIRCYNDKIYKILFQPEDDSYSNYKVLEEKVTELYGEPKESFYGNWTTVIDDVTVEIQLGTGIVLAYTHTSIDKEIDEELTRIQRRNISEKQL